MAAYLLCFSFKLPPGPDPHPTVSAISQQLRIMLIAKSMPQALKPNDLTCFLINHYSEFIFHSSRKLSSFPLETLSGLPNIKKGSFFSLCKYFLAYKKVLMNSFFIRCLSNSTLFPRSIKKLTKCHSHQWKSKHMQHFKSVKYTASLQLTLLWHPPLYLIF